MTNHLDTPMPAGPSQQPGERATEDAATAWAMVEASPDALVIVDEHSVIEYVNLQTEQLLGYPRDELIGREVEMLIPDALRQAHRAHRTRYRAAPEAREMGSGLDLVARRKDGHDVPVEISLSPVRSDGRLRIIAAIRDVSERVERLARDRAIRRGLDLVEDGVFMFERDTLRFSYVNDGAVHQVGYSRDQLSSMTPLHISPEFSAHTFRELLEPLVHDDQTSVHVTTIHRHRDGTDVPVEVVLQAIPGAPGMPESYVALVRDISERRAREAELARAQARSVLMEDRERIGREMHDSVIGRLFATGLTLDATASMIDDDELRRRIESATEQVDQAIKEIRAAVYGSRLRPSSERTVGERISELAVEHERLVGVSPTIDMIGDVDDLDGELAEHLITTLREIMTNSVKHSSATELHIEVEVGNGCLRLNVADNGTGFEPAARPAATTERGHGLNNLQQRAERLGGSCVVESAPDSGTKVTWSALLQD